LALPVLIQTRTITNHSPKLNITYPVVCQLQNPVIETKINTMIVNTLNKILLDLGYHDPNLVEMSGFYEIKTNERHILSLSLIIYSFTGGAHGLTISNSLTFNVNTGYCYSLNELFKPNSPYEERLSSIISEKIKQWDIQLLGEFNGIRTDQDFYLADHSLVIYFQLYEITPYVSGFPYFPIPIYDLVDIIDDNGPLGILLPFT